LSKPLSWRTIGRAIYDISQDTELKGIFGEAFVAGLLRKKKLLKLDNVKCISLNLNIDLHSAVFTLYRLEEYNTACHWGLEPVFEELWRRRSAYEVVSEIRERLSVFVREMGIEDLDKLCLNLVHVGYEATRKCKLCGNPYEPPNFEVMYFEGYAESRSGRVICPVISICTECYRKLLDKGIVKIRRDGRLVPREEYLRSFALLWFYCSLHHLEYIDFIIKIGNVDFFKRIGAGWYSSAFDFICIDDRGGKYVIDVKATTSQTQSTSSKISKELRRSNHLIQLALEQGFRVLVPIIRLEKDWKIMIELVEIT
jgi:hypothetical protein